MKMSNIGIRNINATFDLMYDGQNVGKVCVLYYVAAVNQAYPDSALSNLCNALYDYHYYA